MTAKPTRFMDGFLRLMDDAVEKAAADQDLLKAAILKLLAPLEALQAECESEGAGARGVSETAKFVHQLAEKGSIAELGMKDRAHQVAAAIESVENVARNWEKAAAELKELRIRIETMKREDAREGLEVMTVLRDFGRDSISEMRKRGFPL
jgi:hypothetical protein